MWGTADSVATCMGCHATRNDQKTCRVYTALMHSDNSYQGTPTIKIAELTVVSVCEGLNWELRLSLVK